MLQNYCKGIYFSPNNQKKTHKKLHPCYIFLIWIASWQAEVATELYFARMCMCFGISTIKNLTKYSNFDDFAKIFEQTGQYFTYFCYLCSQRLRVHNNHIWLIGLQNLVTQVNIIYLAIT